MTTMTDRLKHCSSMIVYFGQRHGNKYHAYQLTTLGNRQKQNNALEQGSQTRGPHVAREGLLCGPRCFLKISNN